MALCAGGVVRSEPEHREVPERRPQLVVAFEGDASASSESPVGFLRRRLLITAAVLLIAGTVAVGALLAAGVLGVVATA